MLPHFHTLYLEATRNCNLNCNYCSTGSNGRIDANDGMSYEDIVSLILKPAAKAGTRFIGFSGGEFLIRRDAFDLLEAANELGFSISLVSNGTTLSERIVKEIKKLLHDNIQVSLGVNSFDNRNDETRELPFEHILKKIDLLEKYSIRVNLSVTIGRFNTSSFASTIQEIKNMKLPYNRIPFVIRNCPNHELMVDKNMMRKDFHPTLRKYFNGGVSYTPYFLPAGDYEILSGQTEILNKVPTNPSVGCWCGSFYAINAQGDVSICPLLLDHVSGGNVRDEGLDQILNKSELFTKILDRKSYNGNCGKCNYRFTCGGCRAMAYYQKGDVFGHDPTCFKDDIGESEKLEIETETKKSFKNYVRMAQFGKTYFNPD